MYCSDCGLTFNAEVRYCSSCGKNLYKSSETTSSTRSDTVSYSSSSSGKQYESLSDEEMLQSFVGSNYHYYLDKWNSAPSPQKRAGWNWAAFFFGPLWLAFRKMYRQLAIYYAVVIGGFLSISLLRLINLARYESTDSSAVWLLIGLIAVGLSLTTFFMPFIFGIDVNKWYYNHSQRNIRRYSATDKHQLLLALARTGGTSFLAASFIGILSSALLIIWFVFDTALNGY